MTFTVTQKLRRFLACSGQAVPPWSSVEEVMDRVYGLLYERREQADLWEHLAALLDLIQREAGEMLAAPDAEILSQARMATLVADLRHAMHASVEAPVAGAMRRFALGKSATVLACLALLTAGVSLGCGPGTSCAKEKPPVLAMVGSEAESATTVSTSGDALMDLFRDGSPEDIAAELEAGLSASPKGPKSPKKPKRPMPTPLYKGVSFPTA